MSAQSVMLRLLLLAIRDQALRGAVGEFGSKILNQVARDATATVFRAIRKHRVIRD